jgi:hypothetical protein
MSASALFAEDFPGDEEEGDYLEMYAVVANSHRQEVAAPLGKLLQLVASQATKCTVLTHGSKFAETLPLSGEVIRSILIETECAITFQKTDFTTTQLESMETDGKHTVTFDRCIYSGNKSKVINGTFAVRNAMTDITFKCTRCDVVAPLDGPCDCMRRMASQRIQSVTHRWMERRRSATVVIQKAARCTIALALALAARQKRGGRSAAQYALAATRRRCFSQPCPPPCCSHAPHPKTPWLLDLQCKQKKQRDLGKTDSDRMVLDNSLVEYENTT